MYFFFRIFAPEITNVVYQEVGISLCTRGTATRIVGSRLCHVANGFVTVVSPILPTLDVERNDDYDECVVAESAESVMGETAPLFSKIMPAVIQSTPCTRLTDNTCAHILSTARRIADREALTPPTDIFRQMNSRLTTLMRLQIILETLYEIAATHRPPTDEPSRGEQIFVNFVQSFSRHQDQRLTVADYAAEASLSPRYFSSIIQQHTGQSPMQWIHLFTIGRAKHLLMQTNLQVKEIADHLGFPEQYTFRKYFKTHTGQSPTAYRRSHSPTPLQPPSLAYSCRTL